VAYEDITNIGVY